MFWQKDRQASTKSEANSKPVDYCSIFQHKMGQLYWLAYVLTADEDKAADCYVSGLECCLQCTGIFREWADSWTRRMIIKNAIRSMSPCESGQTACGDHRTTTKFFQDWPTSVLMQLSVFNRFVFVMSVLEKYSVQECAVLLGCCPGQVIETRLRALHQIGSVPYQQYEQIPFKNHYGFPQFSTKEETETYEE